MEEIAVKNNVIKLVFLKNIKHFNNKPVAIDETFVTAYTILDNGSDIPSHSSRKICIVYNTAIPHN